MQKPKQSNNVVMTHVTLLTGFSPAIHGQRLRGYTATPIAETIKNQSEMDSAFNGFDPHR
jgi:hypothetical protein